MKKITTLAIAAALAASMTIPTSAAGLLFSKLSFKTNGGSELKPALTCLGMTIDLSKYVPEREGYTFTGWFTDEALTEVVTELKAGSVLELFAGWEEVKPEEPEVEEPAEGETEEPAEGETEEPAEGETEETETTEETAE